MKECAEMVSTLDDKMLSLNEAIQKSLEEQEGLKTESKKEESVHI